MTSTVFVNARAVCMNWLKMCVLVCVIASVSLIVATEQIRILVRHAEYISTPASDSQQDVCISTRVFYLLRSRRCVVKADDAGLGVLRSTRRRRPAALRQ